MSEPLKVSDPSQKWKILIGLVVVGLLLFGVLSLRESKSKLGGVEFYTLSSSISTTTLVTISNNVVTQIFANEPGAQMRCISNATGTVPVYLAYGTSTGLAAGKGDLLNPTSTLRLVGDSLWRGGIWGIASVTTTLALCQL